MTFEVCEKCGKEDRRMALCADCGCHSVCRFCSFCSYRKCFEYKEK